MANVTKTYTITIAVNDFILDSVRPGNTSGYELVTGVSSAVDAVTNRNVYTITTPTHTIVGDYSTITNSTASFNTTNGADYWVVGQNAVTL